MYRPTVITLYTNQNTASYIISMQIWQIYINYYAQKHIMHIRIFMHRRQQAFTAAVYAECWLNRLALKSILYLIV